MKRFFAFAAVIALLSVPAFAAKNSQNIEIDTPVKVGTTELPAGSYKITWTGTAPNVQLTFAEKGKTQLTVPARLVESNNGHVALLTQTVEGASVLETIQLDKLSIMLTGSNASGE